MLWGAPRDVADLDERGGVLRFHFSYFAQMSPDTVFDVLRRWRTRA